MQSELRDIDTICMEFESSWRPDQGMDPILLRMREYCTTAGQIPAARLFTELCMVDIDRTWRSWGALDFAGKDVDSTLRALADLQQRSRYLQTAEDLGIALSEREIRELNQHEWVARIKYGDAPRASCEADQHDLENSQASQPRISIGDSRQNKFEASLLGKIIIGRQSEGEPGPFSWLEHQDGRKLVCVEGKFPQISRTQLSIEMVNRLHVLIENLSSNRHFSVDHTDIVAPAHRALTKLPLNIDLSILQVRISRSNTR